MHPYNFYIGTSSNHCCPFIGPVWATTLQHKNHESFNGWFYNGAKTWILMALYYLYVRSSSPNHCAIIGPLKKIQEDSCHGSNFSSHSSSEGNYKIYSSSGSFFEYEGDHKCCIKNMLAHISLCPGPKLMGNCTRVIQQLGILMVDRDGMIVWGASQLKFVWSTRI